MLPELAVQVTAELNAPVPRTLDEHEEVAPTLTLVGEQFADTEVIVTGVVIVMAVEADLVGS